MEPLDTSVKILKQLLGMNPLPNPHPLPTAPKEANPWQQVAVHDHTIKDPQHFREHYDELVNGGLDSEAAYQAASEAHGQAPVDLQLKHGISVLKAMVNPQAPLKTTPAAAPKASPPVHNHENLVTNPDTSALPNDYVQLTRPDATGAKVIQMNQKRSDDYKRNLPIFTPEAQQGLATIDPQNIQDYYQSLRKHNHLDNTEVDSRQAMIYNLAKKTPFDSEQFYKDLEQTAYTNPQVYLHALHHAFNYSDVPPPERALNVMAHVGAFFGSDIYNTPLGKYYQGILDPNVSSTTGYRLDTKDTVWRAKDLHYLTPEQQQNDNAFGLDKRLRQMGVPPPDKDLIYNIAPLNYPATTDPQTLAALGKTYTKIRREGLDKWLGEYSPNYKGTKWHHY